MNKIIIEIVVSALFLLNLLYGLDHALNYITTIALIGALAAGSTYICMSDMQTDELVRRIKARKREEEHRIPEWLHVVYEWLVLGVVLFEGKFTLAVLWLILMASLSYLRKKDLD